MPTEQKFLDLSELAERWKVTTKTINREVKRGRLKRTLIASRVRFAIKEIERYEFESQVGG